VPILRRDGELDPTDGEAALLVAMSAATIDRRLAGERAKMIVGGRSHTKPGSLLKSQIPIVLRTPNLAQMSPVIVRPAGQRGDQRRPAPSGRVDVDRVNITPRTRVVYPYGPLTVHVVELLVTALLTR
jgi:hypothetical protein